VVEGMCPLYSRWRAWSTHAFNSVWWFSGVLGEAIDVFGGEYRKGKGKRRREIPRASPGGSKGGR